MAPWDHIYNTLFYLKLMNGPIKLECYITLVWKGIPGTKYLRYSCEASDFGHSRGNKVRNFIKTESFRPRKTSWNTVNFR
jgi:hypothetical protein